MKKKAKVKVLEQMEQQWQDKLLYNQYSECANKADVD